jgi:transposase-like protein
MRADETDDMIPPPDLHYRYRFPAEIISHAVWLYHVFSLSLRDVELILAERGIVVSYGSRATLVQELGATSLIACAAAGHD